jgi:hypothetical protein
VLPYRLSRRRYTLAAEQLVRVAEAAVAHKCRLAGAPKSKRLFRQRIDWLIDEGIISKSYLTQWDAVRQLRNVASHPNSQSIFMPGNAIGLLKNIARQINLLFNSG